METLKFKKWLLEVITMGSGVGGVEQPREPTEKIYPGRDYQLWNSSEKPPTAANKFQMKKKCKKI